MNPLLLKRRLEHLAHIQGCLIKVSLRGKLNQVPHAAIRHADFLVDPPRTTVRYCHVACQTSLGLKSGENSIMFDQSCDSLHIRLTVNLVSHFSHG